MKVNYLSIGHRVNVLGIQSLVTRISGMFEDGLIEAWQGDSSDDSWANLLYICFWLLLYPKRIFIRCALIKVLSLFYVTCFSEGGVEMCQHPAYLSQHFQGCTLPYER